jgi:L-cysteine desulfidase
VTRKCTNEQFIRAYYASDTMGEVAERTGLTYMSAVSRAQRLRMMGIALPRFANTGRCGMGEAEVARLVALAERLLNGEEQP